MPSNEGRGYVLRRIIRRAVRHGNKLGANGVFFYKLVGALAQEMGDAYPELNEQRAIIEKVLRVEEEQFSRTLERGMLILNDTLAELDGKVVPGDVVFKLYDTYGFPADLTNDVAREKGLSIDEEGFDQAMAEQRKRAQKASQFDLDYNEQLRSDLESVFVGYEQEQNTAQVREIFFQGESVNELASGDKGTLILDESPFYAESGGQAGDIGVLASETGDFTVTDTVKLGKAIAHKGIATSTIAVGDKVEAKLDGKRRHAIKLNHSATHLMHAALKSILGEHVNQKGSLVQAERLRFDFSHFEAMNKQQIAAVETMVNEQILANHALQTQLMGLEQAKEAGAMALFGEKYDDDVRVVSMGGFSMELCGGTHVARTGDIGLFKIISESGIASGVRRIEAVTGLNALQHVQQQASELSSISGVLKTDVSTVGDRVTQLLEQTKILEKEVTRLKQEIASSAGSDLLSQINEINGVKVLSYHLQGIESGALRSIIDDLKNQIGSGVILLGVANNDKVSLIAGVTKDLTQKVKAGELVNFVAQQVGGKGGGRPDMAQAGGSQPENLDSAIASVAGWLQERL